MHRSLWLVSLLSLALPAFASGEKRPIPCEELWPAVSATLHNPRNYLAVAVDNEAMRANFVVTGALYPAMNLVELKPGKKGCDLRLHVGFTGADDQWAFRVRVAKALKKLEAAKASIPSGSQPAQ
ncbi:hypothetical protein DYQ86_08240 [Acidobacteria bacterium AB60]|nr:hypothetical protein DYQ86_08240 [Acidobacteria bacterium AB60]